MDVGHSLEGLGMVGILLEDGFVDFPDFGDGGIRPLRATGPIKSAFSARRSCSSWSSSGGIPAKTTGRLPPPRIG